MSLTTTTMIVPETRRLSVFVFYTDFPAGVHAKLVADGMVRLAGAGAEPVLDIWKLDSIPPVGPLKQVILREARQADVWILACSSPCDRDAQIMQWLNYLGTREAGGKMPALLVGLFDAPPACAVNFKWFLDLLALFAERAGQHFVWQQMHRRMPKEVGWLEAPLGGLLGRRDPTLTPDSKFLRPLPEPVSAMRQLADVLRAE